MTAEHSLRTVMDPTQIEGIHIAPEPKLAEPEPVRVPDCEPSAELLTLQAILAAVLETNELLRGISGPEYPRIE